jgi:hypothetical protein
MSVDVRNPPPPPALDSDTAAPPSPPTSRPPPPTVTGVQINRQAAQLYDGDLLLLPPDYALTINENLTLSVAIGRTASPARPQRQA